jgi:hypothetical protein
MKFLPLALMGSMLSTVAAAHPGPHDDVDSVSTALSHVVGSPDHASWLILAITAVLSILAIKAAIRISGAEKPSKKRKI